jgi:hypothetical protein
MLRDYPYLHTIVHFGINRKKARTPELNMTTDGIYIPIGNQTHSLYPINRPLVSAIKIYSNGTMVNTNGYLMQTTHMTITQIRPMFHIGMVNNAWVEIQNQEILFICGQVFVTTQP